MNQTIGMELPPDGYWKHSFDSTEGGGSETNEDLGRAEAFFEIMDEAGIESERVEVAVVVHGTAVFDVVNEERHSQKFPDSKHPNASLVERFIGAGGEIWVCARSANWHGVGGDDLLPGVMFAPAAMVAHAELQRRGFSINPY